MADEKKQYCVSINLVKQYEVYVTASSVAEAENHGMELIEAGEGNLVDDYYQDSSLKAVEVHNYKATQKVTLTYTHYCTAGSDTAARIYAQRQFQEDMASALQSVYGHPEIGPIEIERQD